PQSDRRRLARSGAGLLCLLAQPQCGDAGDEWLQRLWLVHGNSGLDRNPGVGGDALLLAHSGLARRMARRASAPRGRWPVGSVSADARARRARLLGEPARLFLLPEPVGSGPFRPGHRRGLEGAIFVMAGVIGWSDPARAAHETSCAAGHLY